MNLFTLLADDATTTTATAQRNPAMTYIFLGVILVVFVVFLVISNRKTKKQQQEQQNMLNAIRPGNKVKTIGGICGIVTEVNAEDNTFVLETGSETSGKSYIKFDKQAVYQTDAKAEPVTEPKKEEAKKEEKSEPAPEQEPVAKVNGEEIK